MLITIPSVIYEFTRGAESIEQYNNQTQFTKDLGITVINRVDEQIKADVRIFAILFNKLTAGRGEKGPSYTDTLLCTMAYRYRNSGGLKIITANHKDIPLALFDREGLITIDFGNEFRTEAIYSLSENKLNSQLDKL